MKRPWPTRMLPWSTRIRIKRPGLGPRLLVEKNASSGAARRDRGRLGADRARGVVHQLDVFGRDDRARVAVDLDLKFRRLQIDHLAAFAIDNRGIDRQEIDAGSEHRLLRGLGRRSLGGYGRTGQRDTQNQASHTHVELRAQQPVVKGPTHSTDSAVAAYLTPATAREARASTPETAPYHRGRMSVRDVVIVGAGPSGLASAIALKQLGLDYLVLEKGALVESIRRFPINMVFFTTPELMEIGGIPLTTPYDKPTRLEALQVLPKSLGRLSIAGDAARRGRVDRT